jgi:putative nucleotidyltransferase with HDIG domain
LVQNQISIRGKHHYRAFGWKYSAGVRLLLFFSLILLFYFVVAGKLIPKTYDIELGSKSEKTILAPKQIVNSVATIKAEDEAAKKVQPVYMSVSLKNEELVERIFDKLGQVNMDDQVTFDDRVNIYRMEIPRLYSDFYDGFFRSASANPSYNKTLIEDMKEKMNDQQYRIPEEAFFKLPRLTSDELTLMEPIAKDMVRRLMADQIVDAQSARLKVPEMVNASQLNRKITRELVQEIVRFVITPNKFHDREGTEAARVDAREKTEPIYILKGDVLVREGEVITEDIYERLMRLDMLKDNVNYLPQLGLVLMLFMLVLVMYVYIRQCHPSLYRNNAKLLMLYLIFLLNIFSMKIIALGQNLHYPLIGYAAPIAMGVMLITILLDAHLAFISSIVFSVLASIIFNYSEDSLFDFRFGFVAVIICFIAIFTLQRASQRLTILKAGLMVSVFSSLSIVSMALIDEQYIVSDILLSVAFAFSGGILTAILVIGLLPFFEVSFGILSPLKLVELSNPNHPLLRKLLTETPGTYHHSIMVGNLSEAAAESIGANGLLCRVGSFYHDIGKTKRPSYFIENQTNIENPHNQIEPKLSKSIIIAHARDGVEMLKEYKMPKQICDIAEQHHGTTLLKYFYHKANKQLEADGKEANIPEEEYRYPGPKAQSKESAIVGIADCVEAAVRSLRNPTIEQIDSMVRKIIKNRLDDNQFNECDLTLKELDTIGQTLKETLLGIFHSRIEYPEDVPAKSGA